MNARTLGWFVAITAAVFVLVLGLQDVVLRLRVRYQMPLIDSYLRDIDRRPASWTAFSDAIIADATALLHSTLMITFWLEISVLFWGLLITHRDPGSEK